MSGWTWRAPKLMTGSGAATSTHSRAAVAQPVDCDEHAEHRPSRTGRTCGSAPGCAGRSPWGRSGRRPGAIRAGSRPGPRRRGRDREDCAPRRSRTGRPAARAKTSIVTSGSRPSLLEDRLGAREVHVGRVARQDLVRRTSAGQPHQSVPAPVCASSPGWASRGAEVAASVPYASVTGDALRRGVGATAARVDRAGIAFVVRRGDPGLRARSSLRPEPLPATGRRRRGAHPSAARRGDARLASRPARRAGTAASSGRLGRSRRRLRRRPPHRPPSPTDPRRRPPPRRRRRRCGAAETTMSIPRREKDRQRAGTDADRPRHDRSPRPTTRRPRRLRPPRRTERGRRPRTRRVPGRGSIRASRPTDRASGRRRARRSGTRRAAS